LPTNVADSGSISVTISGVNFAVADLSPTGVLGLGVCVTASWVTATTVQCLVAPGTAGPTFGKVTVNAAVGSGAGVFSFDGGFCLGWCLFHAVRWLVKLWTAAPVVSSMTPANWATSSIISVTVSGLDFGSSDVSPSAAFGAGYCGTASWIASTALRCLGAAGVVPPAFAPVTVSSAAGTGVYLFSFDGEFFAAMLPVSVGVAEVTLCFSFHYYYSAGVVSGSP